eukprot:378863-Hanusia_phi.AAC.1
MVNYSKEGMKEGGGRREGPGRREKEVGGGGREERGGRRGGERRCVQMLSCSEYNVVLDKKSAMVILQGLQEGLSSSSSSLPPSSGVEVDKEEGDVNMNLMVLRRQRTLY